MLLTRLLENKIGKTGTNLQNAQMALLRWRNKPIKFEENYYEMGVFDSLLSVVQEQKGNI